MLIAGRGLDRRRHSLLQPRQWATRRRIDVLSRLVMASRLWASPNWGEVFHNPPYQGVYTVGKNTAYTLVTGVYGFG